MLNLTLFVNTSNGTLIAGQSSTQAVSPNSLPLFFGDTVKLKIYLLQVPAGYNATDPSSSSLETVFIPGNQLLAYLDDGKISATVYAQTVNFVADASGMFFTGTLALNTVELSNLIGTGTGANVWLKIGYVDGNGYQTTVLSSQVNVGVGLPIAALIPQPGQTALSVEIARGLYFPLSPNPGQAIVLVTPAGRKILLSPVDRDGIADIDILTV